MIAGVSRNLDFGGASDHRPLSIFVAHVTATFAVRSLLWRLALVAARLPTYASMVFTCMASHVVTVLHI